MFKNYRVRDYDFKLILLMICLTVIGILAIGSAKESVQNKQILGFVMGLFIMTVLSFFDYSFFLRFSWLIYVFNIILLLAVALFGEEVNNAKRWLDIGFQFQPSEISKIMLILFYSKFIMKHREHLNSWRTIIAMLVLLLPPLYLIYDQPDMSTSIVILVVFCVVWYVGGLSYKLIIGVLSVAVPAVVILFMMVLQPDQTIIKTYQQTRILAWLEPEKYATGAAYQQVNAMTAIGSGQLWGKGLNNNEISSVKNGNFISEPQTDFIFTIIGEELGFVGGCIVVILLFLIVLECLNVARQAKDLAGTCICCGMAALIGFQGFINIAVATGLFPNTGIPLPFVSYGLTSLVSLYIGMGFVLNVRLQCVRKYNN